MPLVLKAVEGEAMRSTGYSPFLCFNVADMDSTIVRYYTSARTALISKHGANFDPLSPQIDHRLLQMGAALDGPIKYPAYGKASKSKPLERWPIRPIP